MIDECGLQQGYSSRFTELEPPRNFTFLTSSCKRQHDALRCLRAHAKCLPPLSKQVLLTLVSSRQKYQKKICSEKPSESARKLIEYNECMFNNGGMVKAANAEFNSIITPEAIVRAKFDTVQDRIKQSCCSVAKARKEYMAAAEPQCKSMLDVPTELIDSYLADTVGIICPDFDSKIKQNCDQIKSLDLSKEPVSKSFIKPIISVVQTLA